MIKVASKCCGQCLMSKNKIVSDSRKNEILKDCLKNDTHFLCHKERKDEVVCRGFFEKHSSNMIRIASRLGMIEFVDVEEK